jgi:hypothetical protein
MKIKQINWDLTGSNLAVWPSPVGSDACFRRAGFEDFDDSDEVWDEDFKALLGRAISLAESHGQGRVKQFKGIRGIANPSIFEVLEAPTLCDEFGCAVVEFGDPAFFALATADGHPIIWFVSCPNGEAAESIVLALAGGLPAVRRSLEWRHLIPVPIRTGACSPDRAQPASSDAGLEALASAPGCNRPPTRRCPGVLERILKTYGRGWLNLVRGSWSAMTWTIIMLAPAYLFSFIFPDHMEGEAEGAWRVKLLCFAILAVWGPFLAARVGPLCIQREEDSESGQQDDGQPPSERALSDEVPP